MRHSHAVLLLLATAAIWGFAFLFQKTAMSHIGPFQFVTARCLVAWIVLLPFALREMRQDNRAVSWGTVVKTAVPAALAFFTAAILQQIGLVTATVTNTGFLTALYVIETPLIAWALMSRRPSHFVWAAVVLSFAGTWLLGGGSLTSFSAGDQLVAASSFFWALHVVLVGRAGPMGRPITFTALQFFIMSMIGGAATPFFETVETARLANAWVEIAYVGILSSAITFTLFSIAVRYTGPSEAIIIVSTETLFAAFGAWLLLGERLSAIGWAGAALILTATLIVNLAPAPDATRKPVRPDPDTS